MSLETILGTRGYAGVLLEGETILAGRVRLLVAAHAALIASSWAR